MLGSGNEGSRGWWLGDGKTEVAAGPEAVKRASVPASGALRPPSPVDEVLILITFHLILNGGLQVPYALECQF